MRRISSTTLAALVCALLLTGALTGAPAASAKMIPLIVGGQKAEIKNFPWQVYVLVVEGSTGVSCGGSIIDPLHILTAAHCVTHEGTTSQYPANEITVLAGASDVSEYLEKGQVPPGAQVEGVSAVRTHPDYSPLPNIRDDVAVLTLAKPLTILSTDNTAEIALVGSGATPAPETTLSLSGYGKQNGLEDGSAGSEPDGFLYSTTLTAISSDACRNAVGVNSAVLLCAVSQSSSACQGDSGGPLTEGSPAVEVGLVDFGAKGCPVNSVNVFTNIAAPEIRDFIEGDEAPPLAVRTTAPPAIRALGAAPVDYSPLTCEPGTWTGAAAFTYTFQTEGTSPQVLQSGPSDIFVPVSGAIGYQLVCVVQASNPGGVSTTRSAASSPVTLDTAAPAAHISGRPACHLQECKLQITASDPNADAVTVAATASYNASVRCTVVRRHRRVKSTCMRTKSTPMTLDVTGSGTYSASVARLPYGEPVRFAVLATDAAGLTQHGASAASMTLRAPRRSSKKH